MEKSHSSHYKVNRGIVDGSLSVNLFGINNKIGAMHINKFVGQKRVILCWWFPENYLAITPQSGEC